MITEETTKLLEDVIKQRIIDEVGVALGGAGTALRESCLQWGVGCVVKGVEGYNWWMYVVHVTCNEVLDDL